MDSNCKNQVDKLLPLVYEELHRIAHRHMKGERHGHTLNTTALVHEAYLKLVKQSNLQWENPSHFFAIAAQVMRCILVDYARVHNAEKRGGGVRKLTLDTNAHPMTREYAGEILALDEALSKLSEFDAPKSQLVEYRFFCGLTLEETSKLMEVSISTLKREWQLAKAWLYREIRESES